MNNMQQAEGQGSQPQSQRTTEDYPWQYHLKMIQFGVIATVLIAVLPSLLWITGTGAEELWGSPAAFFRTFAKVTAFSALALFAWTSILGLRIRAVMRLFGGFINKYRVHTKLGRVTLTLAILHPVLLALSYTISDQASWSGIFQFNKLVIATGYFGLLSSIILIIFALSRKIQHARWLQIHTLFAWTVPIHFAHALIAQSEMTSNLYMMIFYSLLIGAQIVSYVLYIFLDRYVVDKHKYTITEVNHINDSITELVLAPDSEIMHHRPGQFAYFSVRGSKIVDNEPHPFTISTADNGRYLRVAIKALGDWSSAIRNVERGLEVMVEGPYGTFCYDKRSDKTQVWLAGGVGVTPFLSMARSIQPDESSQIKMFYSTKDIADAAFFNEILDIAKLRPDIFTARLVTEKYSGYLTVDDIKQDVGDDLSCARYFICGPPGMMHAMTAALKAEGVNEDDIITEEFSY